MLVCVCACVCVFFPHIFVPPQWHEHFDGVEDCWTLASGEFNSFHFPACLTFTMPHISYALALKSHMARYICTVTLVYSFPLRSPEPCSLRPTDTRRAPTTRDHAWNATSQIAMQTVCVCLCLFLVRWHSVVVSSELCGSFVTLLFCLVVFCLHISSPKYKSKNECLSVMFLGSSKEILL